MKRVNFFLNGTVYNFSVDHRSIKKEDIQLKKKKNIRRYLIAESDIKQCLVAFIKKIFFGYLTNIIITSNHTKCVSLNNKEFMIQLALINLHPNEYSQGSRCYLLAVNLDWCFGSCNTLNDLSNRVCVPEKIEDLN